MTSCRLGYIFCYKEVAENICAKAQSISYYYRCIKTYQYNWNACPIKIVNAKKIENYVIEKLKEISQNEQIITSTIDKINSKEETRIKDFLDTEKKSKNELSDIENQIKNIVDTLAEGGVKFKQIKSKLEELENRRKVLKGENETSSQSFSEDFFFPFSVVILR